VLIRNLAVAVAAAVLVAGASVGVGASSAATTTSGSADVSVTGLKMRGTWRSVMPVHMSAAQASADLRAYFPTVRRTDPTIRAYSLTTTATDLEVTVRVNSLQPTRNKRTTGPDGALISASEGVALWFGQVPDLVRTNDASISALLCSVSSYGPPVECNGQVDGTTILQQPAGWISRRTHEVHFVVPLSDLPSGTALPMRILSEMAVLSFPLAPHRKASGGQWLAQVRRTYTTPPAPVTPSPSITPAPTPAA